MVLRLRPLKAKFRNFKIYHNNYGNPAASYVTDRYVQTLHKKLISDDDPLTRRQWKPVSHEKWEIKSYTIGETKETYHNGSPSDEGNFYSYGDPLPVVLDMCRDAVQGALSSVPPDWDAVVREAVPSLRNQFSTINFLLELDDLPKMAKNFRNLFKRGVRQGPKLVRGKELESLSRGALDQYLQFNLGVKPLLSDAEALNDNLLALVEKCHDRAKKIERAREKLETGIRSSKIRLKVPVTYSSSGGYGYEGAFELTVNGHVEVRDHALVRGTYGGPNPFAFALDNLGIYPDLHTLWNAVPFSFLVDYIIPIGDTLEQKYGQWDWQTVGLVNGGMQLIRCMTSVKLTVDFRYVHYAFAGVDGPKNPGVYPVGTLGNRKCVSCTPTDIRGSVTLYDRFLVDGVLDGVDLDNVLGKPFDTTPKQGSIGLGIAISGYKSPPASARRASRKARKSRY